MRSPPNWGALFDVASAQAGFFSTRQAAEVGYSPQLLQKHLKAGRVVHERRGVYRLVHFPHVEHEELASVWLWSERTGVFSHQTALALHGLSDVLPARAHLTLPAAWRRRRLTIPADVLLHYADLTDDARAWFGPVPVTTPARALNECADDGLAPDLLRQAAEQALVRGLVTRAGLSEVARVLEPFGGIPRVHSDVLVTRGVSQSPRGPAPQTGSGPTPQSPTPAPRL
ncbi:MAG: type IV toxin-antitoxin system AbiEi family antitoxin domain-containing protein [Myxococcales bacterium]|nr:type IV toxin-antitoxin system AbiEi family antitoxin domain-containing protein [Myxococcales bacterium]